MKLPLYLVPVAAIFLAGCGNDSNTTTPGSAPANTPGEFTGALGRSHDKAVAGIDLASLTQAIQLFNVNEGHFPKDLNELVQAKLISRIPETPPGKKLVYDPATGTVNIVPE